MRKNLFQLAWPLFLFAALSIATAFADTLILSAHSPELTAAVSLANQVLGVAYDLSGLLALGGLVLIARALGAGDIGSARRISLATLALNTLLSGILSLVLWLGAPRFVDAIETPPDIRDATLVYIRLVGVSMILNGFLTVAASVLRAFGHTVEILLYGIIGNLLFLGLEIILIFGSFGLPGMGVHGAALATVLVRIIGSALFLYTLLRRLKLRLRLRHLLPGRKLFKSLFALSLPAAGDNFAFNLCQLVMVSFLTPLGSAALLVRGYTITLNSLVSVVALAITDANNTLVGYDIGARDPETARRRALLTTRRTAGAVMVLSAMLYAFAAPLAGLFTSDPEILRNIRPLLLLGILLEPFSAAIMILLGSLRSAGDAAIPVAFSISVTWLLALPLAFFLIRTCQLGVTGLWIALTLTEAFKAAGLYLRWQWLHRRLSTAPAL